jgi:hypothetical protein
LILKAPLAIASGAFLVSRQEGLPMDEVTPYRLPLPVVVAVVFAGVGLAAMAITAWLLHQIARRALDKTTPDGVESVIRALSTLIDPLRMFLPWSRWDSSARSKPRSPGPSDKDRR